MSQDQEALDFYGVWLTPEHLALRDIGIAARVLLAVVQVHSVKHGHAWPSNRRLAAIMHTTEQEVQRMLADLVKQDYLEREIEPIRGEGGGQRRYLTPTDRCPSIRRSTRPPRSESDRKGGSPRKQGDPPKQGGVHLENGVNHDPPKQGEGSPCFQDQNQKSLEKISYEKKTLKESSSSARCEKMFQGKAADDDDTPGLLLSEEAKELLEAGVSNPTQAERLAGPYPLDVIQAAVRIAQEKCPHNVPGYLWQMLKSGTWAPPRAAVPETLAEQKARLHAEVMESYRRSNG
jgi:hypothetical protein